jgi:hypothetical protein
MRQLKLVGILLAVERCAEIVDPEALQRLQASARDRVEGVAMQHRQRLFPHQATIDHPADSPIEDRPAAFVIIQLRKAEQLRVRHITRVGHEIKALSSRSFRLRDPLR